MGSFEVPTKFALGVLHVNDPPPRHVVEGHPPDATADCLESFPEPELPKRACVPHATVPHFLALVPPTVGSSFWIPTIALQLHSRVCVRKVLKKHISVIFSLEPHPTRETVIVEEPVKR